MLLAVVSSVLSTPVPSVTPQIIKEVAQPIIQPIAQTPAVVMQLAQMAGLAIAMFLVSTFHQAVEWLTTKSKTGGWNSQLNRALATLYSVGGALVTAYSTGQLKLDASGLALSLSSLGVSLAATFWGYELRQFVVKMLGFVKAAPAAATLLATDASPVAAE